MSGAVRLVLRIASWVEGAEKDEGCADRGRFFDTDPVIADFVVVVGGRRQYE